MDKNQELYYEEQIQNLKQINKQLSGSAIIPIPQLPEKMKAEIVNKITAEITNAVEIDSKPFTELSNDFQKQLQLTTAQIVKAVIDSSKEPLSEITVKNIQEAQAKEVSISNFDELKKHITDLTKVIIANQPIVNVEKQTLELPYSPTKPIAVRLSDGKSFYNAITTAVSSGMASYISSDGKGTPVQLTSTGRVPVELGLTPTIDIGDVQIKDTTDTVIDPATKQNQTSGSQKTQISKSDGTAVGIRDLSETLIATDHALITTTTIHGKTTGGGGFVDVKVTPSGALTVENTPATADTGTVTTASVTNSNTTVLASNGSRKGASIYNEGTVSCFVKLGSTASATSYTIRIIVDAYYEVPFGYTGIITGITASGTATLRVTELE